MLGSARAQGCSASSSSSFAIRPLCTPTTGPCRIGWLFAADRRVALREVAHVHEQLVRVLRHGDALEQLRGRRLLLDDDERRSVARRRGIGVPDRVGSALGDRRQQCLRGKRSIEARVGGEAVSGDSAHDLIVGLGRLTRRVKVGHQRSGALKK